jgi:hypothetical protein
MDSNWNTCRTTATWAGTCLSTKVLRKKSNGGFVWRGNESVLLKDRKRNEEISHKTSMRDILNTADRLKWIWGGPCSATGPHEMDT